MKILKYEFSIPKLIIEDGQLVEMGETKETHTFTLLFKGVDLYEKLSGKALLTDIAKYGNDINTQNIDIEMIKNLAKASFVKIEDNQFHQNMITADEFTKTQAFSRIGMDTNFMVELLNMVVDCCLGDKMTAPTKATPKK